MFNIIDVGDGRFIKAWNEGVLFDERAIEQLKKTATLPFVFKYIAAMPDCHWGQGSTVGTVLPTIGAIVPAAVGVDIGCGMMAMQTTLKREQFTEQLTKDVRAEIERTVPCGRTANGGKGDRGAWHDVPPLYQAEWNVHFAPLYENLIERHPKMKAFNTSNHLGTLGTGNHFIELCSEEDGTVWVLLHSGSRGMGNKIGGYFTELAKRRCESWFVQLADLDLAYLPAHTPECNDYLKALHLAQRFARQNREFIMTAVAHALKKLVGPPDDTALGIQTINCHHNYMAEERHFGQDVFVTRKGAVRAGLGELGIVPGSMGAKSFIVEGLGNRESFMSCSHGAGRAMSRTAAKAKFTVAEHVAATQGVECYKGDEVIDETPGAYKPIEAVMAAQADLVRPIHTLKQFLCVKGLS